METGKLIKAKREELGMTMKELAEKVGVSEGTVSRWESGEIANMRRDKIFKLAKALNISISFLMGWDLQDKKELRETLSPSQFRLLEKIISLPEDLHQEILDYIDYKLGQYNRKSLQQDDQE